MDVREGLRVPRGMWTAFQRNKIRTQVLGNFITMHLSLNEDVEEAKTNLRRFSLIFDITRGPGFGDLDLIRCVLGWEGVEVIDRSNVNTGGGHHSGHAYITDHLSNSTIARAMKYIAKDMEVYAYALELIEEHFESSGALKHVGSEVHASELSVADVSSFMGPEAYCDEYVTHALSFLGVLIALLCAFQLRWRGRRKEEIHNPPQRNASSVGGGASVM
jgi:hypothetical protein